MKEKKITLKVNGITQRQWSVLLLELNIMKKAWKRFGVDIDMSAPGLKAIINLGTKTNEYVRPRQNSKRLLQNQRPQT
jgi:hypothetical protein